MIKTRYQARQLLLTLLIILVSIILGLSLYYVIDDHIKLINTWQYNATYDFEKEIEKTQDGKNTLVCNINNAEQLAGAFAFELQGPPEVSGGGAGSSDGSIDYNLISQFVDSTLIRLTSSIDLSGKIWKPKELGTGVTFDGNGFCIKNLKVNNSGDNLGFISINNGTIKNLVFIKVDITNTDMTQKATANGTVVGENKGIVENVTVVSGSVYANADGDQNNDRRAGGIVGLNNSENAIVRYCTNHATVTRAKFAGGIVGFQGNGLIEYCYNYGDVSCKAKIYPRMGGICAEAVNGTVQYCYNEGEIIDQESEATGDLRAGGILGMQFESVTVQYCGNNAKIYVGKTVVNATYAGGIVGYSNGSIQSCFNRGDITGIAKTANEDYFQKDEQSYSLSYGYGSPIKITCTSINKYKRYRKEYSFVGGIAGQGNVINNCYNTGDTKGGVCLLYMKLSMSFDTHKKNGWGNYKIYSKSNTSYGEVYLTNSYYSQQICPNITSEVNNIYAGTSTDTLNLGNNSLKMKYNSDNPYNGMSSLMSFGTTFSSGVTIDGYSISLEIGQFNVDEEGYFRKRPPYNCIGISILFGDMGGFAYNEFINPTMNGTKVDNIKSESSLETLGEGWNINPSKNDGYPYIEGLYW